jgi:hypothetical protein
MTVAQQLKRSRISQVSITYQRPARATLSSRKVPRARVFSAFHEKTGDAHRSASIPHSENVRRSQIRPSSLRPLAKATIDREGAAPYRTDFRQRLF